MAEITPLSRAQVDAAKQIYDTAQKVVSDKSQDPRLSHDHGARGATDTLTASAIAMAALGGTVSIGAEIAAKLLTIITKAKETGQPGMHDLIVAALGDVLQLDLNDSDVPVGLGPAGQRAVNAALGGKFLAQLKTLFGGDAAVDGGTAEKAAEAFLGFGMQFSASVGFLGLLGELFSVGHVKELSEIGEVLERSLGLGRLTRQVMRPYIRNLVEQPLDRKLRAQYRQDVLGAGELARAIRREGKMAGAARDLLAQHGLPDVQIDELLDQTTPRVPLAELETLAAHGVITQSDAIAHAQADGTPAAVSDLILKALTQRRLNHLRSAVLNEVLSQIQRGHADPSLLDTAIADLGIPADEAELWRKRVSYLQAAPRKRLSLGEMLFLFENSQVTLNQVQQWAESEGFSQEDQLNLQLYFELKATAAHRTASGTSAAAAQHVHDEHVAYVTDLYQSVLGRAPDPGGLAGWVALLDNRQRTKADVKNEFKASPEKSGT